MKRFFCPLVVICTLLIGCSSEDTPMFSIGSKPVAEVHNENHITLDDALKLADAIFADLDSNQTRSSSLRKISKVEIKRSSITRAGMNDIDTLLYLVNYENNSGFALLSADKRLPLLYAISDSGSFEFRDTIDNKGLAFFMNHVDQSIEYRLNKAESEDFLNDSKTKSTLATWPADYYKQFEGVYTVLRPLLSVPMSNMNQRAPWNKYCYYNGIQTMTGCAPLAVATFMSLYLWPQSYNGYDIPWTEIRDNNEHDMFARFINFLWSKDNLNVHAIYTGNTISGIGAYPNRLVPTFENMGYEVPDGLQDFDAEKVFQVLNRGIDRPLRRVPVLARGYTAKEEGHVWVIDGAMKQDGVIGDGLIDGGSNTYYENLPMYLFHCVWGWKGFNNGFFSFDEECLGGDPYYYGEYDDSSNNNGERYKFNKSLQFIGNVIRKMDN